MKEKYALKILDVKTNFEFIGCERFKSEKKALKNASKLEKRGYKVNVIKIAC